MHGSSWASSDTVITKLLEEIGVLNHEDTRTIAERFDVPYLQRAALNHAYVILMNSLGG